MMEVKIPGKVMLSGEYAVLHGGTAVLVAVNRHLIVAESEYNTEEGNPVVAQALKVYLPEIGELENRNRLENITIVRSSMLEKGEGGKKLGLGSSAAEAVGVVALRYERAGIPWRENREAVMNAALEAHSIAQGGLGSGADVAVCAFEAPITFRLVDGKPVVKALDMPTRQKHRAALVWTGESCDSRLQVERFNSWYKESHHDAPGLVDRLIGLSERMVPEWTRATWHVLFDMLTEYTVVLSRCAREAGIPYQLPIHRELATWARERGGKAKPVGAGGGDMALLLGDLPVEELGRQWIPLVI